MKTIFLAAGKSSRMHPISDKNFLEFLGQPLLLILLKNAALGGLENFIIVGNAENLEKIKKICAENDFLKKAIITEQKNQEAGMAGGIQAGLEYVSKEEELFVLGGNDFVEAQIYREIREKSKNLDGGILAKKMNKYFPGGYLNLDNSGIILKIHEKPEKGKEPSNLVNIVGHYFKKAEDLKTELKKVSHAKDDGYEKALQELFNRKKFLAVEYDNFWHAVKYPWYVLEMQEAILNYKQLKKLIDLTDFEEVLPTVFIHKTAEVSNSATFKGKNIVVESGVKIFENAVISDNCYIGKNSTIGNNALVRNSTIGTNSGVGYNTEIARSFLGKKVSSHIAYIGDSIVDNNVNFGAFSCTANLRLDKRTVGVEIKGKKIDSGRKKLGAIVKKDSQIGIHAMLMPGVKVLRNVAAGEILK